MYYYLNKQNIFKRRKDLKLIVASATTDAVFLRNYFDNSQNADSNSATIMSVEGRQFPVDIHYLKGKYQQIYDFRLLLSIPNLKFQRLNLTNSPLEF